jgi:serine/threonine protein kinase
VPAHPAAIGRYSVLKRLGAGAMGEVYLARDPSLARTVAIKLLLYEEREDLRQRFLVEARSAATLSHPNIVTVYDLGDHEGRPYLVMEYVAGCTLSALIDRQDGSVSTPGTSAAAQTVIAISLSRRLRFIEELCAGLGAAHRAGIIHRDVKPANLMIDQRDERRPTLKILDFGIARIMDASAVRMTRGPLGTPRYMAPEQHLGEDCDFRADIFSAGAVFYELLTNTPAFPGETYAQTMRAVCHTEPVPLADMCADLGPAAASLAAIVRRALEKDVERRYQSIEEMREDVEGVRALVASTPTPVPPLSLRSTVPTPPAPQELPPVPLTPVRTPPPEAPAPRTTAKAPTPLPPPPEPRAPVDLTDDRVQQDTVVVAPDASPASSETVVRPPVVPTVPDEDRGRPPRRAWAVRAAVLVLLAASAVGVVQAVRWRLASRDDEAARGGVAQAAAAGQQDAAPKPVVPPAQPPAGTDRTATPGQGAEAPVALRLPNIQTSSRAVAEAPRQQAGAARAPDAGARRPQASEPLRPPPAVTPKAPAIDVPKTMTAAEEAFGAGDYTRALADANAILEAEPDNQPARALKDRVERARAAEVRRLIRAAETSFGNGDYDTAIATLGKALTVDAGSVAAAELLAKVRTAKAAEERRRR